MKNEEIPKSADEIESSKKLKRLKETFCRKIGIKLASLKLCFPHYRTFFNKAK